MNHTSDPTDHQPQSTISGSPAAADPRKLKAHSAQGSRLKATKTSLGLWLVVAVMAATAPPHASAAPIAPSLRFVTVPGYRLTVAGKGWPGWSNLIFSLRAGPWVQGVELQGTRSGSFRVGVKNVNLCGGVTFQVRDFANHRVTLRGPALACPSPISPPVPRIAVMQGKQVRPRAVTVLSPRAPATVTLHLGDKLHLWEPGTDRPSFTARADEKLLSLVTQGKSPPRACPQVDCAAGFYWEWVAIRTGQAQIDLSPACRQSRPACGLPDLLVEVIILPQRGG